LLDVVSSDQPEYSWGSEGYVSEFVPLVAVRLRRADDAGRIPFSVFTKVVVWFYDVSVRFHFMQDWV
jgi:hypothetical protein